MKTFTKSQLSKLKIGSLFETKSPIHGLDPSAKVQWELTQIKAAGKKLVLVGSVLGACCLTVEVTLLDNGVEVEELV